MNAYLVSDLVQPADTARPAYWRPSAVMPDMARAIKWAGADGIVTFHSDHEARQFYDAKRLPLYAIADTLAHGKVIAAPANSRPFERYTNAELLTQARFHAEQVAQWNERHQDAATRFWADIARGQLGAAQGEVNRRGLEMAVAT